MARRIDRGLIEDAAAELSADLPAVEVYAAYIGRATYGQTCIAVAGCFPAVIGLAFNLGKLAERDNGDLEDLIGDATWDSMGTDVVVYFPGWQFQQP